MKTGIPSAVFPLNDHQQTLLRVTRLHWTKTLVLPRVLSSSRRRMLFDNVKNKRWKIKVPRASFLLSFSFSSLFCSLFFFFFFFMFAFDDETFFYPTTNAHALEEIKEKTKNTTIHRNYEKKRTRKKHIRRKFSYINDCDSCQKILRPKQKVE